MFSYLDKCLELILINWLIFEVLCLLQLKVESSRKLSEKEAGQDARNHGNRFFTHLFGEGILVDQVTAFESWLYPLEVLLKDETALGLTHVPDLDLTFHGLVKLDYSFFELPIVFVFQSTLNLSLR